MKNKTNECTLQSRNRLTGMENKLMVSSGKRERERETRHELKRYKLLCIKQLSYKDLLNNTGNIAIIV